jgi:hypothetical protein
LFVAADCSELSIEEPNMLELATESLIVPSSSSLLEISDGTIGCLLEDGEIAAIVVARVDAAI